MSELRHCITCLRLGRHSRVAVATAVCTLRDQALFARAMHTHLVACLRLPLRQRLQIGGMIACYCYSCELVTAVTAIECP